MNDKKTNIDVFIAYARKDVKFLDELRIYLKPLDRHKTIKIWDEGEIIPGTAWETDIKTNLHNADIILLLVSHYSLGSDDFYENEMADALERHNKEKTIVTPVILSACAWKLTDLKKLKPLPTGEKPLKNWDDESSAYMDIVDGLLEIIKEVQKRRLNHAKVLEAERNKNKDSLVREFEESIDGWQLIKN